MKAHRIIIINNRNFESHSLCEKWNHFFGGWSVKYVISYQLNKKRK